MQIKYVSNKKFEKRRSKINKKKIYIQYHDQNGRDDYHKISVRYYQDPRNDTWQSYIGQKNKIKKGFDLIMPIDY